VPGIYFGNQPPRATHLEYIIENCDIVFVLIFVERIRYDKQYVVLPKPQQLFLVVKYCILCHMSVRHLRDIHDVTYIQLAYCT